MHAHMLENEETSRFTSREFLCARRAGRLLGCIALWDQRPFKQVMIRSYSPHVRRWRWLHNTLIPITGQPCLPKPGSPLDHVYLSNVALPEAEIALFPKLLTVAARELWRRNPATIIAAGFDVNDPMLNLVGQQFVLSSP